MFAGVNVSVEGIANRGEASAAILLRAQGDLMNAGMLKVQSRQAKRHRKGVGQSPRLILDEPVENPEFQRSGRSGRDEGGGGKLHEKTAGRVSAICVVRPAHRCPGCHQSVTRDVSISNGRLIAR
jgi:hypothetical protein